MILKETDRPILSMETNENGAEVPITSPTGDVITLGWVIREALLTTGVKEIEEKPGFREGEHMPMNLVQYEIAKRFKAKKIEVYSGDVPIILEAVNRKFNSPIIIGRVKEALEDIRVDSQKG